MLAIDTDNVPLTKWDDGSVRVRGTRLHYYILLTTYLQGHTPEGLLEAFPFLDLATVRELTSYYERHKGAVDAWLAQINVEIDEIHAEHERSYPQTRLKERLLARLAERNGSDPH